MPDAASVPWANGQSVFYKYPKINIRPDREIASEQEQQNAISVENEINAINANTETEREHKVATKQAIILGDGFLKYFLTQDRNGNMEMGQRHVSPWDLWIDAFVDSDIEDAEHITHRIIQPIPFLRQDPTLDGIKRLQPSAIPRDMPAQYLESRQSLKTNAAALGILYEVWHKGKDLIIVYDDEGNIYKQERWPYDLNGMYPFTNIKFNRVPLEFYGRGDPEDCYMLQLEASEIRTQQLNHRRRFNRKYRADPNVSTDDINALEEGEDGTVVRAKAGQIEPIADAPMSMDVDKEMANIYLELKSVTGVEAFQMGMGESGVYSAEAAGMIRSANNLRVDDRKNEIKTAIIKGARITYFMLAEERGWPKDGFKFMVDASTMQPPDDANKRQDFIQLLQVLQPFLGLPGMADKIPNILRDFALAMHKLPDRYVPSEEELVQLKQQQAQQPDPAQMKMQMDQAMMQMKMEIEKQKGQLQIEIAQQKAQIDLQKAMAGLELERDKMVLEGRKMEMDLKNREGECSMKEKEMMQKHEAMMRDMQMKGKEKMAKHKTNMDKAEYESDEESGGKT